MFAELGVARKQTDKARYAFQRSARQAGFFNAGTDRLVEPRLDHAQHDDAINGDLPNTGQPDAPDRQHNDLHPLIEGLVATLPKPGTEWDDEEREAWLTAAKSNFALIYERKPRQLPRGKPDSVGQESDRK